MGVYVMLFAIFFAAHLLSCFWYMMGTGTQDVPGIHEQLTGWTTQQDWDEPELVPLSTKYKTGACTINLPLITMHD